MEEGCFVTVYDSDGSVLIKDQQIESMVAAVGIVRGQITNLLGHDKFSLHYADSASVVFSACTLPSGHHKLTVYYHAFIFHIDLPDGSRLEEIFGSNKPVRFIWSIVGGKLRHTHFTLKTLGVNVDLEKPLGYYLSNRFYVVLDSVVTVKFRGLVVLEEPVTSKETLIDKIEQIIGHRRFYLFYQNHILDKLTDSVKEVTIELPGEMHNFTDSVLWEILKTKPL